MDAQPFILASLALFSVAATLVIGISYISYQMKLKKNPQPAISAINGETKINFIDNDYVKDYRRKTGTYSGHTSTTPLEKNDVIEPIIKQTYYNQPETESVFNHEFIQTGTTEIQETRYPTHLEIMGTSGGKISSLRPVTVDENGDYNFQNDKKVLTFYED